MLQLDANTYEITGGTVTVKAVCTHEGVTPTYAPTEDGTQHTATYSCCGTTVTEDHSGGTATCLVGKICESCGFEYDETTNPDNHENKEEFTYIDNEDGTTHTKKYNCCGAVANIYAIIKAENSASAMGSLHIQRRKWMQQYVQLLWICSAK